MDVFLESRQSVFVIGADSRVPVERHEAAQGTPKIALHAPSYVHAGGRADEGPISISRSDATKIKLGLDAFAGFALGDGLTAIAGIFPGPGDLGTHVFTAIITPDNNYKVLIDDVVEQERAALASRSAEGADA